MTEQFKSGDVTIAYETFGDGPLVVVVHGFASNRRVNWIDTGWVATLTDAGYRVAALDNRGHGESEKLYSPQAYTPSAMAGDVLNLAAHLESGSAALVGYSMGARIAAFAALAAPDKVKAVVMGGLGIRLVEGMADSEAIIAGLENPDFRAVKGTPGWSYRAFAQQTRSDLKALAACMRASRQNLSAGELAAMTPPVLVVTGSEDAISGAADPLARLIPKGEALTVEGRDHMKTTGDPAFKAATLDFLSRHFPARL